MRHPLKPRTLSLSFTLLLLFLIATPGFGADLERMEAVVDYYSKEQDFMGNVLVAQDEEIIFSKSYGQANVEWEIANTADTKFRLGSITKQFTAVAILQLEEAGKLKTSDRIGRYIADIPEAWQDITIFQLLTHSPGLFNVTALPDFGDHSVKSMTPREVLELIMDKPLDFEPGAEMRYSNSGYIALGVIIETASKQPYADYLQDKILKPAGMQDSGVDSNRDIIPRRAAGYTVMNDKLANADYVHMSIPHAAGAMYSTVGDLLRWNTALYNGKLISVASLEKMTTPYKSSYALGIGVQENEAGRNYSHGGGIQGFNTFLSYYPETKVTVAALANVNGNAPSAIGTSLAALAHGQEITLPNERQQIELTGNDPSRFVGTYQGPTPAIEMKVTNNGNQLLTQMCGQRKLPIFPESELTFFAKTVDAQIEFVEDGDKISSMILHQAGRSIEWKKISDEVMVKTAIDLPEQQLQRYVGSYAMSGGMELAIKLQNGKLSGQVTGRPPFDLAPETEIRLFSRTVDLYIDMEMDNQNNVTGLTLQAGPNSLQGTKQ